MNKFQSKSTDKSKEESPWSLSISKYKFVPYLTVNCRRTERFDYSDGTATATSTATI